MAHSLPHPSTGHEPQLGGEAVVLTGFEPLLGGGRRAGADVHRVQAIINAASEDEARRLLDFVVDLGQGSIYAAELAQIIPARARHRVGNWRGSFTPTQRIRAMDALAVIGSYESIPPLAEALSEGIAPVREAAGRALRAVCARMEPEDPRTTLVYRVLVDALRVLPQSARKVVSGILAAAPPELVLGPLLREGLCAPEWWARREAAWVLGLLGDKRATRRLIEALQDSSAAVRTSAAWALGQLEAPVAIDPLSQAANDPDEVVRAAAVEALGAQIARLSVMDEAFKPTLDRIAAALEDRELSVRHAAFETLTALDRPEARLKLHAFLNRQGAAHG